MIHDAHRLWNCTDLDLALGHAECEGKARPLWSGEVLGLLKRLLECKYLVPGEGRTRVFAPRAGARCRLVRTHTAHGLLVAERSYQPCTPKP